MWFGIIIAIIVLIIFLIIQYNKKRAYEESREFHKRGLDKISWSEKLRRKTDIYIGLVVDHSKLHAGYFLANHTIEQLVGKYILLKVYSFIEHNCPKAKEHIVSLANDYDYRKAAISAITYGTMLFLLSSIVHNEEISENEARKLIEAIKVDKNLQSEMLKNYKDVCGKTIAETDDHNKRASEMNKFADPMWNLAKSVGDKALAQAVEKIYGELENEFSFIKTNASLNERLSKMVYFCGVELVLGVTQCSSPDIRKEIISTEKLKPFIYDISKNYIKMILELNEEQPVHAVHSIYDLEWEKKG